MLRWLVAAIIVAVGIGAVASPSAQAHEPGATAVLLDVVADHVDGELQLPLDRLEIAVGLEFDQEPQSIVAAHHDFLVGYLHGHMDVAGLDGTPWTVLVTDLSVDRIDDLPHLVAAIRLTPVDGKTTSFVLSYDAIVHYLRTHKIVVAADVDGDGERSVLGTLNHSTNEIIVDLSGGTASFSDMARLGFGHVLDGTDHLLFLVVLLLPAPLTITNDRRWEAASADPSTVTAFAAFWRVIHVATAFTIGHSVTLIASALGLLSIASQPVEVAVGLSIAIAALHALKPIVRHGEVIIAGGFGLVHGIAFAGILDGYDLATGSVTTSLLGFNVGVELAQIVAVAAVFPWLYELSRGRYYRYVRQVFAVIALVASASWVVSRTGSWQNPLEPVELWVVANKVPLVLGLALLALLSLVLRIFASANPTTSQPLVT